MAKNKHTIDDLRQMQSLPLEVKIEMSKRRITEWVTHFGEDGVYISPGTMGKLTKLGADALLNSYHGAHRTRITGPPGQGPACPPSWAFLQVWTQ